MKSFFFLSFSPLSLASGSPPIKLPSSGCIFLRIHLQPNDSRWWSTSTQLKCTCIGYGGGGRVEWSGVEWGGRWVGGREVLSLFCRCPKKVRKALKMKYECHAGVIRQKRTSSSTEKKKKKKKNYTCPACMVSSITHLFKKEKTMFVMNIVFFFVAQHNNKA